MISKFLHINITGEQRVNRTCRKELIKRIAEKRGLTQREVADVMSDLSDHIKEAVFSGRRVTIAGFGVFRLHETPARKGFKCPANGLKHDIPARKSMKFKQSAKVRRELND